LKTRIIELAFNYNTIMIPAAAGVPASVESRPMFLRRYTPIPAAPAKPMSSISMVSDSMRRCNTKISCCAASNQPAD
jgi:cation transport ATPase